MVVAMRWSAAGIALVAIALGEWPLAPRAALFAAPAPRLALTVRLTTTHPLPPASVHALVSETSAIWRDAHTQLQWIPVPPAADVRTVAADSASLRVVVMAHVVPRAGDRAPWTVGALRRSHGSPPLAIASVTGARRIVDEASRFLLVEGDTMRDRRLGIVLGRAIAHEIGHYLLQTDSHAVEGLMRANIDVREFADLRARAFRLDASAQAHLAALAERGARAGAPGAFVYPE